MLKEKLLYLMIKFPNVNNIPEVSYGFLPKHFNIGSALTVKMNDQFFLVGILIRTTDSRTVFRSLEKFVETIHMKGKIKLTVIFTSVEGS